ncbi:MAG: NADH:flavin oxidoreductase, partial [Nitrospirae bacterium]|nr:NADH:flavin oxidoreductase [Nitrospirota bacterium]
MGKIEEETMIFESFTLKGVELKNRLVRSATYEKRADESGFVTDGLIDFYETLTRGGVGLIITGNTVVHPSGISVPQVTCIYDDKYVSGLKRLCDAVHALGGRIFIQLVHGGRQCFPSL